MDAAVSHIWSRRSSRRPRAHWRGFPSQQRVCAVLDLVRRGFEVPHPIRGNQCRRRPYPLPAVLRSSRAVHSKRPALCFARRRFLRCPGSRRRSLSQYGCWARFSFSSGRRGTGAVSPCIRAAIAARLRWHCPTTRFGVSSAPKASALRRRSWRQVIRLSPV